MAVYSARKYHTKDDPGILALINEHMRYDGTWPSVWVRQHGDLLGWLKETTELGRWVGIDKSNTVLAHVGIIEVPEGHKAEVWTSSLGCDTSNIAEIGKLVVHPEYRREGISNIVTRCCVRQTVEMGLIPVASAFGDGKASIAMMTSIGWKIAGSVTGLRSNREIVLLTPPQQLVDAALIHRQEIVRTGNQVEDYT